jgi:hypothetical protein
MEMTRKLAGFTIVALALTLTVSAFAGSKSQTVTLYHDAQLNGKTLPAGDYDVKYESSGSTAKVKFLKNGKEVVTADGQVKQLSNSPQFNQVVTSDGNGSQSISEIDFAHSNTGVTFQQGASTASAGSN